MAIRKYKPTTPARRHMTVSKFEGIDKKAKPERSLTEVLNKKGGRNNYGRITVRHRGGGGKKIYRIIDFKRDKEGQATVLRLEYDPNRSANIALIQYEDGTKAYIIAQSGLKAGDVVESGPGSRHQARQLPAHRQHPRWYRHLTASNCTSAAALSSSAQPASAGSADGKGRRLWHRFVCPPAKYRLIKMELHAPSSARSAMKTTATSTSVRPAASVTWASVPPSAAPS